MIQAIRKVKCSGVELEYLLTGEENEETIMLVHGAGANLRQFISQHEYFSKDYRVLSVSLRGHGRSGSPDIQKASEYALKKHRDNIIELLMKLEIENLHFIGNSAGGLIGYELINKNPSLFKSFITFGTTAELKYSRLTTNLISAVDKAMLKMNSLKYCKFIAKHSSNYENVQQEVFDLLMMSTEAIPFFRKNLGNYSYLNTLENMFIPFLLIQGEKDQDINKNLDSTVEAINLNKQASIVILSGAGHFANLDKPMEFNRVVEKFIKSVSVNK